MATGIVEVHNVALCAVCGHEEGGTDAHQLLGDSPHIFQPEPRVEMLIRRIETFYDFQCEAGSLAFCVDWLELKALVQPWKVRA